MAKQSVADPPAEEPALGEALTCEVCGNPADHIITDVDDGATREFCTAHMLETFAEILTQAAMQASAQAAANGTPF